MQNAKKSFNESLRMRKKIVHAGGAYIHCYESEEDGQLDLGKSKNGLKNRGG